MTSKPITVSDAFLKKVAFRVNEIMLERFDSEPSLLPEGFEPSEKFKKAMEDLIVKLRNRRRTRSIRTVLIVAAIIVMLFACAMSVTAIRRAIYEFFMSFRDDHAVVSYEVVDDTENAVYVDELTKIETYYEPTYILGGMEKVKSVDNEIIYTVVYKDEVNVCCYKQELLSILTVVDYENDVLMDTEINGFPAFYSIDNSNNNVYLKWSDDKYLYTISFNSSGMNLEEVIKMAESLSIVK